MEIGNFRWRRFLYMTIQYSVIPYDLNLHSQQTEKVWKSHLLQDKSSHPSLGSPSAPLVSA